MKNLATRLLAAAFTTAALPAFAVEPSVQVGYSPEGGSGNPRKFRHSALWNFLGVVRGMTTRQRLPHLSEALWRDAETPGNSATPVPGPQ